LEIHRDVIALEKAFAVGSTCWRLLSPSGSHGSLSRESATRGGVCRIRDRHASDVYPGFVVTRYRRRLGRRGDVHALLAHQPFDANPTFESTFEVARELTSSIDSFVEYVGDYPNHVQPTQVIDTRDLESPNACLYALRELPG
jgi:hypothetical protein